jgi:hypothetical protein
VSIGEKDIPRRTREAPEKISVLVEVLEEKKLAPPKPARWYDRAWAWANGKKLWAGAALMISGGAVSMIPGTQAAGFTMIGKGVFTAGSILAGTGLVHKILKQSVIGAKGKFGNRELIELAVQIILLAVELWKKLTKKRGE